jgi:hypothetical protein
MEVNQNGTYSNWWPNGDSARHVNCFDFLYSFLAPIAFVIIDSVLSNALETPDTSNILVAVIRIILLIVLGAGIIYFPLWNLKHKGRSLWNIFWLFAPFGRIIFWCIKNRDQQIKENNYKMLDNKGTG